MTDLNGDPLWQSTLGLRDTTTRPLDLYTDNCSAYVLVSVDSSDFALYKVNFHSDDYEWVLNFGVTSDNIESGHISSVIDPVEIFTIHVDYSSNNNYSIIYSTEPISNVTIYSMPFTAFVFSIVSIPIIFRYIRNHKMNDDNNL